MWRSDGVVYLPEFHRSDRDPDDEDLPLIRDWQHHIPTFAPRVRENAVRGGLHRRGVFEVYVDMRLGESPLPRQAAAFDHPRAVETIVRETGCSEMKAIIHCQGSTSFMMSAVAGLVPQVTTILTNAVSLHPVVTDLSYWKIKLTVPLIKPFT